VRECALERLRRFGVEGKRIYLIDLIPLIEMIWAGGRIVSEPIELLYQYANRHLCHINAMAGYLLLTTTDATNLAAPYLTSRPDMAVIKRIRECIVPVRLGETRNDYGDMIMNRIMSACREILSMSVTKVHLELQHVHCSEEIDMYLDIMKTFRDYNPDFADSVQKTRVEPLKVHLPKASAANVERIAF
jgi:hypothetical protein